MGRPKKTEQDHAFDLVDKILSNSKTSSKEISSNKVIKEAPKVEALATEEVYYDYESIFSKQYPKWLTPNDVKQILLRSTCPEKEILNDLDYFQTNHESCIQQNVKLPIFHKITKGYDEEIDNIGNNGKHTVKGTYSLEQALKILKDAGFEYNSAQKVTQSVEIKTIKEKTNIGCLEHPLYSGMRLGANAKSCSGCVAFYEKNKRAGIKEVRNG